MVSIHISVNYNFNSTPRTFDSYWNAMQTDVMLACVCVCKDEEEVKPSSVADERRRRSLPTCFVQLSHTTTHSSILLTRSKHFKRRNPVTEATVYSYSI